MKLRLHNICAIKEAEVKIDGLTVIAGENNAGKSTIGKMLYTLVKTLNNYNEDIFTHIYFDFEEIIIECQRYIDSKVNHNTKIYKYYKELYRFLFKIDKDFLIKIDKDKYELPQETIRKEYEVKLLILERYMKDIDLVMLQIMLLELTNINEEPVLYCKDNIEIQQFMNRAFQSEIYDLQTLKFLVSETGIIEYYIEHNDKVLNQKHISYISKNKLLMKLISLSNSINKNFIKGFGTARTYERPLSWWLYDEFKSDISEIICKCGRKEVIGNVSLQDNFGNEFSFDIKESGICVRKIIDDLIYKQSTYIESPIFLYLSEHDIGDAAHKPDHIVDLLRKISCSEKERGLLVKPKFTELEEILQGNFGYDSKQRDFWYQQGDNKFAMSNVANGAKSFGIIQMLYKNGWMTPDNIMIIDEPEVHLHPKWQVEYCRIIIALIKKGIKFVITTHSPYILQALKKFSEDLDITKDVNFYLSEQKEDGVIIQDKTKKLGDIYEKLTAPLREIM